MSPPSPSTTRSRLLGTAELASYLGLSTSTIYTWRSQGRGPRFVLIGDLPRYRIEDVEAWVAAQPHKGGGR